MSPLVTAIVAFLLIMCGILIGIFVRSRLPEHHLTGDSKDAIRLATALVGTLTALVVALMFAATRTSFEHTSTAVSRLAADMTELDIILEEYGPEALPIRRQLRAELQPLIDSIWQQDAEAAGRAKPARGGKSLGTFHMINGLQPKTPEQTSLKVRALQLNNDIFQARLSLFAQPPDSVSSPFMVVLVLWLVFLFTTFAMSSKPNITLAVVLCVCVVSASAALYLILELGLPFSGVMQVSSSSLRATLPPL